LTLANVWVEFPPLEQLPRDFLIEVLPSMKRIQKLVLSFLACCLIISIAFFLSNTFSVHASSEGSLKLPDGMEQYLEQLRNDDEDYTGVIYAPGVFAFPIISQPENNDLYVSIKRDLVTLFSAATVNGVTGLLAHNFLAGAHFYDLQIGQEIWLVEDETDVRGYQITDIQQYQRVDRLDGDIFIDLETQTSLDTSEIFDRYYTGEPHLTLQTCLENEGDPSWGLTFIVAEPISIPQ
jgi:hypothetical protein